MPFNAPDLDLRPFDATHCGAVTSWVGDELEHFHWTARSLPYPATAADLREVVARRRKRTHQFLAGHLPGVRVPVAYGELSVDQPNRSGRLGRIVVDPARRGIGVGAAFVTALLDLAHTELGLHRVDLLVAVDNGPAITAYERAGLSVEGTLVDARHYDGQWRSMHVMTHIA